MGKFSKLGFILATLGSSIGLGHIWRFPYMVGHNGGSAFVLLYLVLTLSLGIAMLLVEMLIGNLGKKDVVSNYQILDPKRKKYYSFTSFFILGGPLILSFYAVVLGWVLYYLFVVTFDLPKDLEQAKMQFSMLQNGSLIWPVIGFSACLLPTIWFVSRGIEEGIEKLNVVLMPLLFVIFIGLLIYAMTLESMPKALHFLFNFEIQKIDFKVVMDALGQMFFSLSLGVGTIITYSAFTPKKENLLKSSLFIVLPGILISLIAGVMIFTFVFEYHADVSQGPGLVFISLPLTFAKMGISGQIVSLFFFIALVFAGITSTVSLIEPLVLYLINRFNFSRLQASLWIGIVVYVLGVLVILSMNERYAKFLSFAHKSVFGWLDFITSSFLMPLGGLFSVLFVGWVLNKKRSFLATKHFFNINAFKAWHFSVRFIAPVVILAIFILQFK
ncbi:transporter [Helicobacter pylori Hp P-13]|uniref:Neurotransmitter symporter family protein n=1 Tax=Helicobacter pylori Hp P-13b TaxID=992107 RepID=A0ABC9QQH8_HELPX|nr:sodium-dependent transporter [Helicobacter pylori]EJC08099.1 transporter [Helicobacter pylori Hp P-13]EJC31192.1 neurotransmitter symporter family protein [Helicobacter pylori Hp P-13b]